MLLIPLALIHGAESVIMDGCHPSPDLLLGAEVTTEPSCCTDEKTEADPPCAQPQVQPDSLPKYLVCARTGKVGKRVGKVSSVG